MMDEVNDPKLGARQRLHDAMWAALEAENTLSAVDKIGMAAALIVKIAKITGDQRLLVGLILELAVVAGVPLVALQDGDSKPENLH